jgi:hypothetical protein
MESEALVYLQEGKVGLRPGPAVGNDDDVFGI